VNGLNYQISRQLSLRQSLYCVPDVSYYSSDEATFCSEKQPKKDYSLSTKWIGFQALNADHKCMINKLCGKLPQYALPFAS